MASQAAISARPGTIILYKSKRQRIVSNDTLNRIITLHSGIRLKYPPGHRLNALWIPFDLA